MKRGGFTLIDLVLSIGVIILLFGGIYLVYFSILDVSNNTELRTLATTVLSRQIEVIRNMPYAQVGVVGGVPAGIIPQSQDVIWGEVTFKLDTAVHNIDDPYDGTILGSPQDTSPADYKLVELTVRCPGCAKFVPLSLTASVAPKGLESASENGALFVNVIDANGLPVSEADVHVVNSAVTPPIDIYDSTNASGTLQLVDVATSTNSYEVSVGLAGYSSDKTYAIGAPANPNPIKPHATVAERAVTQVSFAIDRLGALQVFTQDKFCAAAAGKDFSLRGAKLIGTTPDVPKYATATETDAQGVKNFGGMEWDTYAITMNIAEDLLGSIPHPPFILNPSTTLDVHFILQDADPNALLVTVKDSAGGEAIPGASVTLSKIGYSRTVVTGRNAAGHTDWSGSAYAEQSGGIEAEAFPGSLLLVDAGGYATGTESWLVSRTIDAGGASSTFYSIAWNPVTQPPQAGADSLRIQIASNNDNATWDFTGPDGTSGTFYASSGSSIAPLHNGHRYLRYKIFMKTEHSGATPQIDDVTVGFSGPCIPPSQALFGSAPLGTYALEASAPGYADVTSTVEILSSWQQEELTLERL